MTTETSPVDEAVEYAPPHKASSLEGMPLAWIEPSPLNPRRRFDEESLAELAESIKTHGLLEPLVVRQVGERPDGSWRCIIIAGERRWRAAKLAGLTEVPVRLLEGIDERRHVELALLENLQRQDLDPLEEAAGYKALSELGYTQTQIAAAVKRSQPVVARVIGLLNLPPAVQDMIREGQLSPSHGVVLAPFAPFPAVCEYIAGVAAKLSWPTKVLADRPLANSWEMEQAGLIKTVREHEVHFDMRICKSACPFGAYTPQYESMGYCLKPEHYKQLQKEADEAERQRVLEAKRAAKMPVSPGEKAEAAAAQTLPRLETLKNVENLSPSWSKPPAACTELCPCSGQALDREGKVVRICTDPKRLASLKAQQTKMENAAKRQEDKERRQQLTARLAEISSVEPRELALAVCGLMQGRGGKKEVRAAADALVPGIGEAMGAYDTWDKAIHLLCAQDAVTLVRLATTIVLLDDLLAEYSGQKKVTWWLTSGAPPPATATPAERPLATYAETPMLDELIEDLDEDLDAAQTTWTMDDRGTIHSVAADEPRVRRTRREKLQERLDASHDAGERVALQKQINALREPGERPVFLCHHCQQPIEGTVHHHNSETWCPTCATTVGPWKPQKRTRGRAVESAPAEVSS